MFDLLVNIITLPLALASVLIIGTSEIIYSGNRDVSKEKKFEHLVSKTLVMKTSAFYFQWSDTKQWSLHHVGSSMFPASIEDYERDRENWMHTDANAQKGHGVKNGYLKEKITGIVPTNTNLTIVTITLQKSIVSGNKYNIYAKIDNGPFSGNIAEISCMFKITSLREHRAPEIDERVASFAKVKIPTTLTTPP